MLQTGSRLAGFKSVIITGPNVCSRRSLIHKNIPHYWRKTSIWSQFELVKLLTSEEFQNKAPGLFIRHTQTKRTNGVLLCILFVLINHRRSEERREAGGAGAAAGAMYLPPTFLAPSCSSWPSYKSPLTTRPRGRRDRRRELLCLS